MRVRRTQRTHLRKHYLTAEVRGLQRGLGAGKSAADYVDLFHYLLGYVLLRLVQLRIECG
jgi:hypothetical protein